MHPLFHLIATRPQLLAEHMEAYAELVSADMGIVSASWKRGALLNAGALVCLLLAAILGGVALMLWAVIPVAQMQAPWALWAVPLPLFAIALACFVSAHAPPESRAFDNLRRQVKADMALLREGEAV